MVVGESTRFPLGAKTVKQNGNATSSAEAELVAAFVALKVLGIHFVNLDFETTI